MVHQVDVRVNTASYVCANDFLTDLPTHTSEEKIIVSDCAKIGGSQKWERRTRNLGGGWVLYVIVFRCIGHRLCAIIFNDCSYVKYTVRGLFIATAHADRNHSSFVGNQPPSIKWFGIRSLRRYWCFSFWGMYRWISDCVHRRHSTKPIYADVRNLNFLLTIHSTSFSSYYEHVSTTLSQQFNSYTRNSREVLALKPYVSVLM